MLQTIGMLFIQGKESPTILDCKTRFGRRESRPKAEVVALNQRDAIAIFVDDAQIDCVAFSELRVAMLNICQRFADIDQLAARVGVEVAV